jgi:hypothetical protein
VAEEDRFRKQVEEQRAAVVAWFQSGPGGVIAAVFVVALVGMLILAAVGLL